MCTTMTVRPGSAADGAQAREINAIAGILGSLAIELAPPFDAAAVDELRAANRRFAQSGGDAVALAVADHELHRRLSEPCADERLLKTLASVRRSIYRWHLAVAPDPDDVERAAADHDAIIDALERGDHPAAAQELREHVAAGLSRLLTAAVARPAWARDRFTR
jgi:DNA-binding GntR family transcriptional regulator